MTPSLVGFKSPYGIQEVSATENSNNNEIRNHTFILNWLLVLKEITNDIIMVKDPSLLTRVSDLICFNVLNTDNLFHMFANLYLDNIF